MTLHINPTVPWFASQLNACGASASTSILSTHSQLCILSFIVQWRNNLHDALLLNNCDLCEVLLLLAADAEDDQLGSACRRLHVANTCSSCRTSRRLAGVSGKLGRMMIEWEEENEGARECVLSAARSSIVTLWLHLNYHWLTSVNKSAAVHKMP